MKYLIGFGALALILTLFGLVSNTVSASTQVFSKTFSHDVARWNDSFILPKADPDRGILTQVVVKVSGNMKSAAHFTQSSLSNKEVSIDFDGMINLHEPHDPTVARLAGASDVWLTIKPTASINEAIPQPVGRSLFKSQLAPKVAERVATVSRTLRISAPGDLRQFQGQGMLEFPVQGDISATIGSGNRFSTFLNSTLVTEVTVEYVYRGR